MSAIVHHGPIISWISTITAFGEVLKSEDADTLTRSFGRELGML